MRSAHRCLVALTAPLLVAGLVLTGGAGEASPRPINRELPAPVAASVAPHAPFTARVSVTNAGRQRYDGGSAIMVSDNGRFVLFTSAGASGPARVRDRWTHTTQIVSRVAGRPVTTDEAEMSRDGHHVVFETQGPETGWFVSVFERDLITHKTVPVCVDRHGQIVAGLSPSVSAHGRYVAFWSNDAGIVPGDTNGQDDVFVRDMLLHRTVRVSVSSTGRQTHRGSWTPSPVVRGGRLVYFWTNAAVLTGRHTRLGLVGHNLRTGATWWAHRATGRNENIGGPETMSVSTNGKFLAFNRRLCRNGSCTLEIYVRNRSTGAIRLASVDNQGRPIPDVDSPSLSAGGRFVAFSTAYRQRGPIGQVWLRDRYRHRTWRISVGLGHHPGDHDSWGPAVSADGRIVAFSSEANNLVRHDTNGNIDAFIRRVR